MAPLWTPSAERAASSRLQAFLDRHRLASYDEAWTWSVDPPTAGEFWAAVADWAEVRWTEQPTGRLERARDGGVFGARWFDGGRLNYAERCLTPPAPGGPDTVAVVARSDSRPDVTLTWAALGDLVTRVQGGLAAAGVGPGDCVAGYLPNIPETLAAMLAAAALGATWTCCAPEMGVGGTLDRLTQAAPTVLVAVDGYRYGSRAISRVGEIAAIRAGLPSVRTAVLLPYLDTGARPADGWTAWSEFTAALPPADPSPVPVAFDDPLYVLYSSGTTGKPKAIIHGHGGILLEHAKALSLHFDLGPGDRFFWYTTTGWMMWNFLVSGLAVGAAVVMFDGDPGGGRLWSVMSDLGVTCGGVGAGYLVAGLKAGNSPGAAHDLSALRTLGSTGSPLPSAAAEWVYERVGADLMLSSFSGGTDVCTGFVGGSPLHAVWAGEISCRCLGAAVEVFDDDGRPVVGVEGELVLTAPLPSMPVGILGDHDGSRYRATYFERFPGVWAHGDRATLTERGTVVITGRSDGTLNRGGVRMGTAEFYAVVEGLVGVADSLAVHLEDPSGGPGELMLFVVPTAEPSPAVRESLAAEIRTALRRELSPRHVPDLVELVPAVPRTLSGKKLEVPVKRILSGVALSSAVALASVADPDSLQPFVDLAEARAAGSAAGAGPGGETSAAGAT